MWKADLDKSGNGYFVISFTAPERFFLGKLGIMVFKELVDGILKNVQLLLEKCPVCEYNSTPEFWY